MLVSTGAGDWIDSVGRAERAPGGYRVSARKRFGSCSPAGDMIVYPATSLHNVTPITRGSRIASFFWTQSMIRDESKRSLLFDMDMAIIKLNRDHPGHPSNVELTAVYHNLLRQWAEL